MKRLMSMTAAMLLLLALPLRAWAEGDGGKGTGSIFDLLADSHIEYKADLVDYYLTEMYNAAVSGDVETGRAAQRNRDELIEREGSGQAVIAFDDLYLLSRLICSEAGCDWLSQDFRMCVGEVVMNRVASPEYPDTLREVVYQKGQYSTVSAPGFESLVPTEECVDVALRLLRGERKMVESVVFQSNTIQGELFTMYTDRTLGNTYFCLSENQDLYPIG